MNEKTAAAMEGRHGCLLNNPHPCGGSFYSKFFIQGSFYSKFFIIIEVLSTNTFQHQY